MGCNLLITGIYWGYNPFTNHLLTSWDILVSIELAFFNRKRRSINSATNQAFECFFPHLMSFQPRKNQHTTPGHPRSNQKLKVRLHIMQFVPKKHRHNNNRCVSGSKIPVDGDIADTAGSTKDLSSGRMMSKACAPGPPWLPWGFTLKVSPRFSLNKKHMGKTTRSKESLGVLWTVLFVRPKKYDMMGIFLKLQYLTKRFGLFLLLFFCSGSTTYQRFHFFSRWDSSSPNYVTLYLFFFLLQKYQLLSIGCTLHPLTNEGL